MKLRKEDLECIAKLKQETPFSGMSRRVSDSEEYRLRVLGRGEMAYYQLNERALLFELLAGQGIVFAKSIRYWDNGRRVTQEEKAVLIQRLEEYLRSLGAPHFTVV